MRELRTVKEFRDAACRVVECHRHSQQQTRAQVPSARRRDQVFEDYSFEKLSATAAKPADTLKWAMSMWLGQASRNGWK